MESRITFWKQPHEKTWKRVDWTSSKHVTTKEMVDETISLVEQGWKLRFDDIKRTLVSPSG